MASVVDICNKALSLLGQESIINLNDQSPQAYACRLHWPSIRDEHLRGHPWNCATKRVSLNRLVTAPAFGFKYQYQLPSDYLMVLITEPEMPFEVEGKKLLCDAESVAIRYVHTMEDATQFDPQLASAFSYLLASELAYQFTRSNGLAAEYNGIGKDKLGDAKATDSFESRRREKRGSKLLNARNGRS